jgi:hypothetical protein
VTDFPCSLIEFQQRFPDEAACVDYLALGAPLLFKPQSLELDLYHGCAGSMSNPISR